MSNFKSVKELNAYLKTLKNKLSQEQLQYPLNCAGRKIRTVIEESFINQASPDGKPWEPLAKSTKMKKLKNNKSSRILRQDGYLQDNWEIATTKNQVKVFNNSKAEKVGYGINHQFGNSSKKIPARPFLPIDDKGNLNKELEKDILKIFENFLKEAIQ